MAIIDGYGTYSETVNSYDKVTELGNSGDWVDSNLWAIKPTGNFSEWVWYYPSFWVPDAEEEQCLLRNDPVIKMGYEHWFWFSFYGLWEDDIGVKQFRLWICPEWAPIAGKFLVVSHRYDDAGNPYVGFAWNYEVSDVQVGSDAYDELDNESVFVAKADATPFCLQFDLNGLVRLKAQSAVSVLNKPGGSEIRNSENIFPAEAGYFAPEEEYFALQPFSPGGSDAYTGDLNMAMRLDRVERFDASPEIKDLICYTYVERASEGVENLICSTIVEKAPIPGAARDIICQTIVEKPAEGEGWYISGPVEVEPILIASFDVEAQ